MNKINHKIIKCILFVILTCFIVYKMFLEDSIHIQYMKYYKNVWNYTPTKQEKEYIVYLGEKGYECRLGYASDEGEPTKFDTLYENEVYISCAKNGEEDYKSKSHLQYINGRYYVVKYTILITRFEDNYHIESYTDIDSFNTNRINVDSFEEYISPNKLGYYHSADGEYNIFINRGDCLLEFESENEMKDVLFNKRDILKEEVRLFTKDEEYLENLEEKVVGCNETIDMGYGENMYYDVIEDTEKKVEKDINYGDKLLNE